MTDWQVRGCLCVPFITLMAHGYAAKTAGGITL